MSVCAFTLVVAKHSLGCVDSIHYTSVSLVIKHVMLPIIDFGWYKNDCGEGRAVNTAIRNVNANDTECLCNVVFMGLSGTIGVDHRRLYVSHHETGGSPVPCVGFEAMFACCK